MEKLPNLKPNLQEIANNILEKCFNSDHASFIISELLKHLETPHKRTKISLLNQLKQQLLVQNTLQKLPVPFIKSLFGTCLSIYEKAKEIEIRKGALEVLKLVYQVIKETAGEVTEKLNREVLRKELIAQLEKMKKINENERISIFMGNDNRIDQKNKIDNQIVDLNTAIAPRFLKIQYTFEQNVKLELLAEFNKSIGALLENSVRVDKTKDCNQIFSIITSLIEETNMKVQNEALKSLQLLIRLYGKDFPFVKIKYFIILLTEKFIYNKKNTQNAHNKIIQSILNEGINSHCITLEAFLEIFLTQIENNRSQAVRLGCIEHLQNNFVEEFDGELNIKKGAQSFTRLSSKIWEKQKKIEQFQKELENKLQVFIEKEKGNVQLKRACEQLVDKIKHTLENPKNKAQQENKENIEISQNNKVKGKEQKEDKKNRLKQLNSKIQKNEEEDSENEIDCQQENNEFASLPPEEQQMMTTIANELKQLQKGFTESQIVSRIEPFINMLDQFSNQLDCLQSIQEQVVKKISKFIINLMNQRNRNEKGMKERITEFLWNIYCTINKVCMELTSKSLYQELKVLVLEFGKQLQARKLELLLDSAYMTCSLENFLKITYFLFEKINAKGSQDSNDKLEQHLKLLVNWLCSKIQKCSTCLLSEGSLKFLEKSFASFHFSLQSVDDLQLQSQIVKCLNCKLKNIETEKMNSQILCESNQELEKNENEKNPPGKIENTKMKLEEISQSLNEFNQSFLQSQQLQPPIQHYQSPNRPWLRGQGRGPLESGQQNLTAPSQNLEDSLCMSARQSYIQKNNQTCTVNNLSIVSEMIEKNGEDIEFEEMKALLENICVNLGQEQVEDTFKVLEKFRALLTDTSPFMSQFLQIIFSQFCTNQLFEKYINEQPVEDFLHSLLTNLPKDLVLPNYKKSFKLCKKQQNSQIQCEILIKLMFQLLCQKYFPEGVDLENAHIFVESAVYCLENKELASIGEQWMREVFERLPEKKIQLIFEQELITQNNDFFVYLNWQDQYFEEKLAQELAAKDQNSNKITIAPKIIIQKYSEKVEEPQGNSQELLQGIDSLTMGNYQPTSNKNQKTTTGKSSHFQFLELDSLKQFQNNYTQNLDMNLQSPSMVQYNQDMFSKIKDNTHINDNTLQLSLEKLPQQQNTSAIRVEEEFYGKSFFLTEEKHNLNNNIDDENIQTIKQLEEKLRKEMEKNVATLKLLERVNLECSQLEQEKNSLEERFKTLETRNKSLEQENYQLRLQAKSPQQPIQELSQSIQSTILLKSVTTSSLLQTYSLLQTLDKKLAFIHQLQSDLSSKLQTNYDHYEMVLHISLILCVRSGIQKQEDALLQELQLMLEYLLTSVPVERVVVAVIRVVGGLVPAEYSNFEFVKEDKMVIRLALKCLERLRNNCEFEGINIGLCLTELFTFFQQHPPELLYEDVPCVQDIELIFRSFKSLADKIIETSVEQSKEFILKTEDENKNSVFYTYIVALINQYSQ